MARNDETPRDLLFGLLALQNGLIDQDQLVAAFGAWSRAKGKNLAEILLERGSIDEESRALLAAMAEKQLKLHGGDTEKSLAAVGVGPSTREKLTALGDAELASSIALVGSHGPGADATATTSFGTAASDSQRFRILRPHAKGGLGAVFVALDGELNREVALKRILDSHADDPTIRARFVREAEITGGLEHPGIVPVYGLGAYADGRPYYAMRFIRGDSLKQAVERFHADESLKNDPGRGSLELRMLLRRFTDICNAVEYAHSRGVIHRDIKPANIIVGDHGETLLVDWGLAKAVGRPDTGADPAERTLVPSSASGSVETLPGSALGTPAYMSPEQARGEIEHLGPRSDIYSLGTTLYYVLTSRPPVSGELDEVLRAVQRSEVARPREVEASIDPALEAIVLNAMAFRPSDRYESARAMAEDVERWMADEPVSAWREPLARRASRWARRHRTGVTAAAAALVAGVVGLAAVLAVQAQANRDLQRANSELATAYRQVDAANAGLQTANVELASANARVTHANAELESANQRERQRFDLAMAAIKLFHGEVSGDLLMKEKQFEGLRTKLLRGAADFYGKLEGLLKGQSDPKSRTALGRAYDELGDLTAMIGNQPEALAVHLKALAVRRELAAAAGAGPTARPGWREARLDVARSLMAAGILREETGDAPGALASYEEARALAKGMEAPGHTGAAVQDVLGWSHRRIGALFYRTGKPAEALAAYEQARSIHQKLADANPANTEYQTALADSYFNFGLLFWSTGRHNDALAVLEQARVSNQRLASSNPSVPKFQRNLATTYSGIGLVLSRMGRTAEALAWYEKGRVIQQELADGNPNVTLFQSDLARVHNNIGEMFSDMGKPAEALAALEKGRAIRQALVDANLDVTMFQRDLAISLSGIGQLRREAGQMAEAVEAYRRALAILERLPLLPAYDHFNMGSMHARLARLAQSPGSGLSVAEGRAEADRAMTWLRKAVDGGYRPPARVLAEPQFDPLRSRRDFQLLMMDLNFPAEPFVGEAQAM